MSAWQTVPGLAAIIICLAGGGLLREGIASVYHGKPVPYNLDQFTKALLLRDLEVLEERKSERGKPLNRMFSWKQCIYSIWILLPAQRCGLMLACATPAPDVLPCRPAVSS